MWQGFSHVFLTAVWFGSKMRPNPHGKSHHFLSECLGNSWLGLVKNPCHYRAWKTNKSWISDMKFGVDLDQTATKPSRVVTRIWRDMEFPRESMTHFLQGFLKFWNILKRWLTSRPHHNYPSWREQNSGQYRFLSHKWKYLVHNHWKNHRKSSSHWKHIWRNCFNVFKIFIHN